MSSFVDCHRSQAFLLPPELRDWIPEDDLVQFVIEAVERVDLATFKVNHCGTGSAQVAYPFDSSDPRCRNLASFVGLPR